MGSAWKRKSYGKVRPVPQAKVKAPDRPSVRDLSSIFKRLQRSPDWQHNDILSEAIAWWHNALPFFRHKYRDGKMGLYEARALDVAGVFLGKAQESKDNKIKAQYLFKALLGYKSFGMSVLTTPDVAPYLKASKEVTKKVVAVDKNLNAKYDKVLTLLSQCFPNNKLSLVVSSKLPEDINVKIDHEIGKIYYSRGYTKDLSEVLRKEGLLKVALNALPVIARANSIIVDRGHFEVNEKEVVIRTQTMMYDFAEWCTTADAPKRLVVKKTGKVRTKRKISPEHLVKLKASGFGRKKKTSVLDVVSIEEVQSFMANAKKVTPRQKIVDELHKKGQGSMLGISDAINNFKKSAKKVRFKENVLDHDFTDSEIIFKAAKK